MITISIYVISDTHFNHANIIKYCNRPYANIEDMNKDIIDKWNSIITNPLDIVYHLGDVAFGGVEKTKPILAQLNGYKLLVLGNHDIKISSNTWKAMGFSGIYNKPTQLGSLYILSHEPLDEINIPKGAINIHGHVHDNPLKSSKHICVSIECTGYKPVKIFGADGFENELI